MVEIPIILLAAGGSTRMGRPKQLLPWGNQTLIEHQIQTLMKTGSPVNVILGSDSNLIIPVINKYSVNFFINNRWENGMGNSIAFGINQTAKLFPSAEGVLISLLDQPMVNTSHYEKMIGKFQSSFQQIIVSHSDTGWNGVPVLFDNCYFAELETLDGEEGAKVIIQRHKNSVINMDCKEILEDMDTPEVYQEMVNKFLN